MSEDSAHPGNRSPGRPRPDNSRLSGLPGPDRVRYKFVELSTVTDDTIERAVNEWVARGWLFDGIRFVMTEASRRPAMAFISFVREAQESEPDATGKSES